MRKKIIVYLFFTLLFVCLLVGFFFFRTNIKEINRQGISAVPINAPFIAEVEDMEDVLKELMKDTPLLLSLKKSGMFTQFLKKVYLMDSLIRNDDIVKGFFTGKRVTVSIHITGKSQIEPLFIVEVKNYLEESSARSYLLKLLSPSFNFFSSKLDDIDVFNAVLKKNKDRNFYFSFDKGLFFFSFSKVIIQNGLLQNNSDVSLLDDKEFTTVAKTIGRNVNANIYINYKTFSKLLNIFLSSNKQSNFSRSFADFANWAELDVNLNDNNILLNGFNSLNHFDGKYLGIFINQEAKKMEVDKILPYNISSYFSVSCSDINLFQKNYKFYLGKVGRFRKYNANLQKINNLIKINIDEIFCDFLEDEITTAHNNKTSYAILKTKGKKLTLEHLTKITQKYLSNTKMKLNDIKRNYIIDEDNKFVIYKMPIANITEKIFGDLFSNVSTDYYTLIDNYLVFSDSYNSLTDFIKYNIRKNTLNTNKRYSNFKNNMSSKSIFFLYYNPHQSKNLYPSIFKESLMKKIIPNQKTIKKNYVLGLQFSSNKNMIYNNLLIEFDPVKQSKSETVWQSRLDAKMYKTFKPQLVTNHYSKQKELCVQDINNVLYLINYEGKILWKRPIEGKIMSRIFQIDYFKNGKLQLLFNTKTKLYLIDRNGNNVQDYPISLKTEATNGITVLDYNNNKDYRILLACKNKKIYNLDKKGMRINGWDIQITDNYVKYPIKHYIIENKDYIVCADKYNIYILNRKGNIRLKVKKNFALSEKNYLYLDKDNQRFVTTDNKGHIRYIYFTGDVKEKRIKDFSEKHFFIYQNINATPEKEYIFLDEKYLEVYDENFSKLFDFKFNKDISLKPLIYKFSYSDKKIGITNTEEGLIYLINNDGKLHKDFPLKGITPITINATKKEQSKLHLFVGSDDNYFSNYTISP